MLWVMKLPQAVFQKTQKMNTEQVSPAAWLESQCSKLYLKWGTPKLSVNKIKMIWKIHSFLKYLMFIVLMNIL